jgi:predicted AAA+ superfamily ATPase
LLESLIKGQKPSTVFIDEIQRLPSLLNTIQDPIDNPARVDSDRQKRIKFYLTGSSARKLRRGEANLLPGRIFTYQLGGLCARELDYKVDLERALHAGLLPEPYLESSREFREKLLESYSATYLKEEIQSEALTRNLQGFARFLTTVATLSGSVIDYSKIATKAKVSRSGAIRFLEILEDTLVATRLPPFDENPAVDSIKHPKLFFFDLGVLNGLLGSFDPRFGS